MVFWATLLTALAFLLVAGAIGFLFKPVFVRLYRYWVSLNEREANREREERENEAFRRAAMEELENLEKCGPPPTSKDQAQPNRTRNPK